jgi:hypothetical protein
MIAKHEDPTAPDTASGWDLVSLEDEKVIEWLDNIHAQDTPGTQPINIPDEVPLAEPFEYEDDWDEDDDPDLFI